MLWVAGGNPRPSALSDNPGPLVDENGENITSTEKVANKFCKYFTNIGPNLADKMGPASKSF